MTGDGGIVGQRIVECEKPGTVVTDFSFIGPPFVVSSAVLYIFFYVLSNNTNNLYSLKNIRYRVLSMRRGKKLSVTPSYDIRSLILCLLIPQYAYNYYKSETGRGNS